MNEIDIEESFGRSLDALNQSRTTDYAKMIVGKLGLDNGDGALSDDIVGEALRSMSDEEFEAADRSTSEVSYSRTNVYGWGLPQNYSYRTTWKLPDEEPVSVPESFDDLASYILTPIYGKKIVTVFCDIGGIVHEYDTGVVIDELGRFLGDSQRAEKFFTEHVWAFSVGAMDEEELFEEAQKISKHDITNFSTFLLKHYRKQLNQSLKMQN